MAIKVYKLPVTKITNFAHLGAVTELASSETPCGELEVTYDPSSSSSSSSSLFDIRWTSEQEATKGRICFCINHIAKIEFSNSRSIVTINLLMPPLQVQQCESQEHPSFISNTELNTVQLVCTKALPDDVRRSICDEVKSFKAKTAKKRMRNMVENDESEGQEEMKKKNSRIEELVREKDQLAKQCSQLKEIERTGLTPSFERDFYNPVVYAHTKLQTEVNTIRKAIIHEPDVVNARLMGVFDPVVLRRARITEAEACFLHQTIVRSPSSCPSDKARLDALRRQYGQEVVDDVIRCRQELEEYNASAGHPIYVPWNSAAGREMTPSEMVAGVLVKTKELKDKVRALEAENKKLRRRSLMGCAIM